jgi:hypothetical protein
MSGERAEVLLSSLFGSILPFRKEKRRECRIGSGRFFPKDKMAFPNFTFMIIHENHAPEYMYMYMHFFLGSEAIYGTDPNIDRYSGMQFTGLF